jgi:hypothetical protein
MEYEMNGYPSELEVAYEQSSRELSIDNGAASDVAERAHKAGLFPVIIASAAYCPRTDAMLRTDRLCIVGVYLTRKIAARVVSRLCDDWMMDGGPMECYAYIYPKPEPTAAAPADVSADIPF